ncbi:MAG: hypothetical protein N3A71_00140 [Candidatus Dojkabacteria bacterium]|nr:hypothetical protein [Candidatus Dojkabacteria bacterium]
MKIMVKFIFFIFIIFYLINTYTNLLHADSEKLFEITPQFVKLVQDSDCPDIVKSYISSLENKKASLTLSGNVLVDVSNPSQKQYDLSCLGPNIIETIIIRITTFIYMVLGAVSAFGLGKSTILISTSSDNAEQKQKGWQGITNSIIYILVGIFSYFIITFIIVGVLGLGNNGRPEQNILCQQQIVFDVTFGDGIGSCQ